MSIINPTQQSEGMTEYSIGRKPNVISNNTKQPLDYFTKEADPSLDLYFLSGKKTKKSELKTDFEVKREILDAFSAWKSENSELLTRIGFNDLEIILTEAREFHGLTPASDFSFYESHPQGWRYVLMNEGVTLIIKGGEYLSCHQVESLERELKKLEKMEEKMMRKEERALVKREKAETKAERELEIPTTSEE